MAAILPCIPEHAPLRCPQFLAITFLIVNNKVIIIIIIITITIIQPLLLSSPIMSSCGLCICSGGQIRMEQKLTIITV